MPILARGPSSQPTPSQYQLAQGESFTPESVTATFDGSGAASPFLAALSVYAQSGELIGRTFPAQVAAGDIAKVTFAPLLRAAEAAAGPTATNLPFANWMSGAHTVTPGGATFQHADGQDFFTTDGSVYAVGPSADVGSNGLNSVLLIKAQGVYWTIGMARYLTPFGNPDEPAASLMWGQWDSFNYTADQLDFSEWGAPAVTGIPSGPFGGSIHNVWRPWLGDLISYAVAEVSVPYMEYVPSLYNAGGQNMVCNSYLFSVRIGDAVT